MTKISKKLAILALLIICALSFEAKENNKRGTKFGSSSPGDTIANTSTSGPNLTLFHEFPFTDKRMKAHQRVYEELMNEIIIKDLKESKNLTEAFAKYPLNSPVTIRIESKYAFLFLIDEKGVSLYTFQYELVLTSCGPSVEGLKLLNVNQKKGDLFNLQSVPSKKYKLIIEQLIKEAYKYTKYEEEQEIPLFITVHPSLTFHPAAIIEDKLENLRVDFPAFNVKYCQECQNVLPFDEYAYRGWFGVTSQDDNLDNVYSRVQDQLVINIGFYEKAIFLAYPLDIAPTTLEDDKIIKHQVCDNNKLEVQKFVQNAYYERSLERFANDMLYYFVKQETDKADATQQISLNYPCYPKFYHEKLENIMIHGSGDLEGCKEKVKEFMNKNYVRAENVQNFGLPTYEMPWPLEGLKNSDLAKEATIYIESEDLEELFKKETTDKSYYPLKVGELVEKIEDYCKGFFSEEGERVSGSRTKKEYLNSCLYLQYINSLLSKINLPSTKEVRVKLPQSPNEGWIKSIVISNIETHHSLEHEWFLQAQEKGLESYLLSENAQKEKDKEHALSVTFVVILVLCFTFWLGFIVRFRKSDDAASKEKLESKTK